MAKPVLDRTKSFGIVYGRVSNGAKYEQHGLQFDLNGECITEAPEGLKAAQAFIEAEANPVDRTGEATHYAHRGNGAYDVYNGEGVVVADNVTKERAGELVPVQALREDLGTKARSDLIAHVNVLGGTVVRTDGSAILIEKIIDLTFVEPEPEGKVAKK